MNPIVKGISTDEYVTILTLDGQDKIITRHDSFVNTRTGKKYKIHGIDNFEKNVFIEIDRNIDFQTGDILEFDYSKEEEADVEGHLKVVLDLLSNMHMGKSISKFEHKRVACALDHLCWALRKLNQ